jgi:alpha-amylase/alpha-mannosidase (GH57 family)
MTQVAILWHMHQPFYEDLLTHDHILPWVRLHALKDYFGMVALLEEFPGVRLTFNLVPSLLVQVEAFAMDRARDRSLELSLKPASDLTDPEVEFMLEHFFHAQRQRMIEPYPRYRELLARRGNGHTGNDAHAAARWFSREDLRDLQVWHKLVWIDPLYQERDERIRRLFAKGAGFSEDDKIVLREVELELLRRVIPAYRAAADRGQIELSASPFYHPILPLLCDSNIYLRTHPDSPLPRRRFRHVEDAEDHLRRATALHERLFGRRPAGLWPSEGSVSDAVVALAAKAGFSWMATDELILGRTEGISLGRDAAGHLHEPERLYAPFMVDASGGGSVACVFRDHVLSDLIGFVYASWDARAAADDFVSRLSEAGRRYAARTGGQEALIPVILDGENAWEHFAGGGRPFLRALYGRLASHPDIRTVTMREACANPRRRLVNIFPGSWSDANFSIWMGHADDRRAWSQLADAREVLDDSTGEDASRVAEAREEILIAEGSDWFWWYGDDHSSAHDREFDDLFRRHLRNAYSLLNRSIPDELLVTNITTGPSGALGASATAFVTPTIDGEETSYFEWLGAGTLVPNRIATADTMHPGRTETPPIRLIHAGFDRTHLYLRVDGVRPMRELLDEGHQMTVVFLRPQGLRMSVRGSRSRSGQPSIVLADRVDGETSLVPRRTVGIQAAAQTILEIGVPFTDLGVGPGAAVSFFILLVDSKQRELLRIPAFEAIEVLVPDDLFEARNWSA